jgi:hypothetical protein
MPPPARFCTTKTQNGPRRVNKERMEARCANSSTKDQAVHTTPQSEICGNVLGHYFVALSRQVVSWKFDMPQIEFGTHLVAEHSRGSKSRLLAVHRCAELFFADRFLRT